MPAVPAAAFRNRARCTASSRTSCAARSKPPGFRFVAEADFLRNPADPRDRNTPEPPQPKNDFVMKFVKP